MQLKNINFVTKKKTLYMYTVHMCTAQFCVNYAYYLTAWDNLILKLKSEKIYITVLSA